MQPDHLSTTFAAFGSHPTGDPCAPRARRGDGPGTGTAVRHVPPGRSKHLKVLQKAGLVVQGRNAQWRPCQLQPEPLREVSAWVEQYRRIWEARLAQLDDLLRELHTAQPPDERATT